MLISGDREIENRGIGNINLFMSIKFFYTKLVLCPTSKLQNDYHSRAGGSPVQRSLDSRFRGNDGRIVRLGT